MRPGEQPLVSERTCLAIVLAAGEGTRMRSARPKVLHRIAGQSLLAHVLDAVSKAGGSAAAVVVGPNSDTVATEAKRVLRSVEIFVQAERRGTAHAVLAARDAIARTPDDVLVIFGDTPLIRPQTLLRIREALAKAQPSWCWAFGRGTPPVMAASWLTATNLSPFARNSMRHRRSAPSSFAMVV